MHGPLKSLSPNPSPRTRCIVWLTLALEIPFLPISLLTRWTNLQDTTLTLILVPIVRLVERPRPCEKLRVITLLVEP